MHNSSKDPKVRFLRNMSYVLIIIFVITGTYLLTRYAQGFQINPTTGEFTQNGLVLIKSTPVNAAISINDQISDNQTPDRQVLPVGDYKITLNADGYRQWSKDFKIVGSDLVWLNYPLLIPLKINSKTIAVLDEQPIFNQSPNKRFIISGSGVQKNFSFFDISVNPIIETTVKLPREVELQISNKRLMALEFADSNTLILAKFGKNKNSEFVVVDRTNPEQSAAINATFETKFHQLVVDSEENGNILYGLESNSLRQIDLADEEISSELADNVESIVSANDNTVAVIKEKNKFIISYLDNQPRLQPIARLKDKPKLIKTTTYNNKPILVVSTNKETLIYKNFRSNNPPKPTIIKLSPRQIELSGNNRMIGLFGSNRGVTHDLEFNRTFNYRLPKNIKGQIAWLDGFRLAITGNNKLQMMDYDGDNRQVLTNSNTGLKAFFDDDSEAVFSFNKRNTNFFFERSSLVVDN